VTATVSTIDAARRAVAARLLAERSAEGHWVGDLSSSPLSTATAVVALGLDGRVAAAASARDDTLVKGGIAWLLSHQNEDGGWGDTDRSVSNISTTALVWAALAFAEPRTDVANAAQRAETWLVARAGALDPPAVARAIVDRYGRDRTFSVPILTMCALGGRLGRGSDAWTLIPQLPFELSIVPRRWFTVIHLPVVSYALPALIAMGLVRHRLRPSRNPITRAIRDAATKRALDVLAALQPPNGGFLEATPLTSFVVMALIAAGRRDHPVVRLGLDFLRASARHDGSWPIDTNLSTWVTTLSVQALNGGGRLGEHLDAPARARLREWLLAQQTRTEHAYTGAAAGAWSWTPLPGGVPDADDTPGTLLALRSLDPDDDTRRAAAAGVRWLLDLQNRDGGMPTFCRGWGALPFDRSGADLTAHAIRAWLAWRPEMDRGCQQGIDAAIARAVRYLVREQRADGAFIPLWFGNQCAAREENPTYGTSRVLVALQALEQAGAADVAAPSAAAIRWLMSAQNVDGGWGGEAGTPSTIEETSLAVAALAPWPAPGSTAHAIARGVEWLEAAVTRPYSAAPIGFYFAKLWYYEKLYPTMFAVEAFERIRRS
jgi:squalene-hopene/tetraprenyl-beta-curcumene cyclase